MLGKLPWIDALRGLAIFGVLIYHVALKVENFPGLLITEQGQTGVQLFYIISAFTLFLSLSNRKKQENRPTRNFFIRRFFRIAPLFYCAIIYYIVKLGLGPHYWLEEGNSITIPNLISHIFFFNGWNPYWINSLVLGSWSIAIEMPFYLIVPFLFRWVKTINHAVWLTVISFLFSKIISWGLKPIHLISDPSLWKGFLFYWLPNQFPFFSFGFILYFLFVRVTDQQSQSEPDFFEKTTRRALLPLLLVYLFLVSLSFGTKINFNVNLLLYGVVFVELGLYLSQRSCPLLVNHFWCYLGKISYSSYLIHFEIVSLGKWLIERLTEFAHLSLSPLPYFALLLLSSLAGTMAVSSLTYQFIELPGMNLGRSLITRLELKEFDCTTKT